MSDQTEPVTGVAAADGTTYQGVSQLLNSIARDLDHMLHELGQSPPPSPTPTIPADELASESHYRRAAAQPSSSSSNRNRRSSGDALLEQFVQSLIDSLTLPGTPPDGRTPVLPSTPLCLGGLNGGGQDVGDEVVSENVEGAVVPAETPPNGNATNTTSTHVVIEDDSGEQACDISLLERIIRTHPVWFLPGITRAGAVHLLQGKDPGNFIVRKSSKGNTMAISVRLPNEKGPYIEHYLIEAVGRDYQLEGSDNHFEAIPTLVSHYCHCCDELPVQLTLPWTILQAATRQELSSLAMLGQDFWVSFLSKSTSATTDARSTRSPTDCNNKTSLSASTQLPTLTTFGPKTPLGQPAQQVQPVPALPPAKPFHSSTSSLVTSSGTSSAASTLTPKTCVPPPPPPRWCKPAATTVNTSANITVTTTVTFNVDQCKVTQPAEGKEEETKQLSSSLPAVIDSKMPIERPQVLLDSTNVKVMRRRKKTTHYTQSNVADSPPDYYRSSLADKISDYEDIWATPTKPEVNKTSEAKPELVTFRPGGGSFKNSTKSPSSPDKGKANKNGRPGLCNNQTDQEKVKLKENGVGGKELISDICDVNSNKSSSLGKVSLRSNRMRNKLGLTIVTGSSSSPDIKKHSSPFYAEPVDSLNVNGKQQKNLANHKAGTGGRKFHPKSLLPSARLLNHRHSDPNIQWPPAKNGGALETIYGGDDAQSNMLSSSLNNLNGHSHVPGSNHHHPRGGFMNSGFRSQSSHLCGTSALHDKTRMMIDTQTQTSLVATPKAGSPKLSSPKSKPQSPRKLQITIPKLLGNKSCNDSSWPVDSSWEWLGNDDESLLGDSDLDDDITTVEGLIKKDAKFPIGEFRKETSFDSSSLQCSDRITVEDLIQQKSPDLHVPEIQPLTKSNLLRVSEYDNIGDNMCHEKDNYGYDPSETASSVTEFSEPWDSSRWDQLLQLCVSEADVIHEEEEKEWKENNLNASIEENEKNKTQGNQHVELLPLDVVNDAVLSCNFSVLDDDGTSISSLPTVEIDQDSTYGTQRKLQAFLPTSNLFLLRNKNKDLGGSIKEYVLRLSQDKSTTFGKTIENFIQCTLDSHETSPHIVMRNVRQFMSGIKNYLVKHGEGQFEVVVQKERSKLKANEFLNLDAILEGVLHKIVIKPLKKHIYQLFVNEYTKTGALRLLSDNIKYARTKTPEEFGVKCEFSPPQGMAMDTVHHFLRRLQQVYSPLKKLENLLAATACIFSSVHQDKGKDQQISIGADDYLPMLMYVLVHCGMIAAEIEADYMWGLLHPSLLTGEGGYYLTTLSSAVHVLKSFQKCHGDQHLEFNSVETKEVLLPNLSDMQGFMNILIPDELNGSIITKPFPVRPTMNTKDVGKMIAHKFNITNPQDFGLFKLVNGEETLLLDTECPYVVKVEIQASGLDCAFAYKRVDAKIAWPILTKKS